MRLSPDIVGVQVQQEVEGRVTPEAARRTAAQEAAAAVQAEEAQRSKRDDARLQVPPRALPVLGGRVECTCCWDGGAAELSLLLWARICASVGSLVLKAIVCLPVVMWSRHKSP